MRASEFFGEIDAPIDALGRQIGIQLEWMPAHQRPDVRRFRAKLRERRAKPTPPDETPRANDVRDHVDRQRAFGNDSAHWVTSVTIVRDAINAPIFRFGAICASAKAGTFAHPLCLSSWAAR